MAPSPENDNAPKAPDKGDKAKGDSMTTTTTAATAQAASDVAALEKETTAVATATASGSENKEASVSRLDDVELKALLDEAINYKIPKDRVGKSKLFQNLLEKAEEDDRKARATSASGSESVRYYNTTATHRTRRRREPNSVSENLTHGGSLNNLAKEELYVVASQLHRPPKTVSARQRQGGSLPCNVNAGVTHDRQFFEEETTRRRTTTTENNKKAEYTAIDMESESLLEHDSLGQCYGGGGELSKMESVQTRIPLMPKYTSRFNLEIGGGGGGGGSTNVDDSLTVPALEMAADKTLDNDVTYKAVEPIPNAAHYSSATHYSLLMPAGPIWSINRKSVEDKKVDENGNALGQNAAADTKKGKKKKVQTDKNVVVLEAKDVAGHRSDIINDLDKLVEYIGGNDEQTGTKSRSNVHKTHKFHKQQQHHFGGGGGGEDKAPNNNKKQRVRTKGGKPEKLQKCNSMEEISVTKLDDFSFVQDSDVGGKAPLRGTKSNNNATERPRERRSWGNSESLPLHASAENLESSDFRVVTKKKKSKRQRRNSSVGGGGRGSRQPYDTRADNLHDFRPPEPRRKTACSVPHSDKSNDSSDDVDSVHSLPVGTERAGAPVSYADIAKNTTGGGIDRPKWSRPPSERKTTEMTGVDIPDVDLAVVPQPVTAERENYVPPDVHNIQNWPTIQNNNNGGGGGGGGGTATAILVPALFPTAKNNHNALTRMLQAKSQPNNNNNMRNNLKNMQQHKTAMEKQLQAQQQQQQYTVATTTTLNRNNVHDQICLSGGGGGGVQTTLLPRNIPDVQTIEKMHLMHAMLQQSSVQSQQFLPLPPVATETTENPPKPAENYCDSERRTTSGSGSNSRPAVVILSGDGNEVSGLTFGFDVNEQLLSDDVCDSFTARFYVPNAYQCHNHDKIVNFIGMAWEDTINQTSNGKVKYFSDRL